MGGGGNRGKGSKSRIYSMDEWWIQILNFRRERSEKWLTESENYDTLSWTLHLFVKQGLLKNFLSMNSLKNRNYERSAPLVYAAL